MQRKITNRQKDIVTILAKHSDNDKPITMSKIAEQLNLSTRTILREMSSILDWFYKNNFKVIKKPGFGLILDESDENKEYILYLINQQLKQSLYNKDERKLIIIASLIFSPEPIKASYFQKILKVSENTLNEDFKNIEKWFLDFKIKLIKKQGIGSFLEGKEKNLRDAYIYLIYENYDEKQLINILQNCNKLDNKFENNVDKVIFKLIDYQALFKITSILKEISLNNINLSDNSYVEILIRISLIIIRVKNGKTIKLKKNEFKDIISSKHFEIAKRISLKLESEFNLNINNDEVKVLAIYIKASKLSIVDQYIFNGDDIKVFNITKNLINLVQKDLKINLNEDKVFLKDLINHLYPSIFRMSMAIKIRNPFLNEIKEQYLDVYLSVSKNMSIIKNEFSVENIPEQEIGYITMHFVAAIEKLLIQTTNINVVISCPTGIGTSRVLFQKLKEKFQNINIVETISSLNIDENLLKNKSIDLIISTVNLNTSLPCVCVTPLLTYEDEKLLKKTILFISKNKLIDKDEQKLDDNFIESKNIEKKLTNLMYISKEILQLLDEFLLFEELTFSSFEDLIYSSAKIFSKNKNEAKKIEKSLQQRIEKSFSYFEDIDIFLLHAAVEEIDSVKVAVLRLQNNMFYEDISFKYILFMLIPKKSEIYQQEILSQISYNLFEDSQLVECIKNNDQQEIVKVLNLILLKYYKNKIKELNIV